MIVHRAAKIDHFPMKSTEVLAPSGLNTGNFFVVGLERHRPSCTKLAPTTLKNLFEKQITVLRFSFKIHSQLNTEVGI